MRLNGKIQAALAHGGDMLNRDAECQSPSLPELQQPLPQRLTLPTQLQSGSNNLDDAESTLAQVGTLEPDVPASQMPANKRWQSFACGAEQGLSSDDSQPFDRPATTIRRGISPGISQYGLSSEYIDDQNGQIRLANSSACADVENNNPLEQHAQGQKGVLRSHDLGACAGRSPKSPEVFAALSEASSPSVGSSSLLRKQHSKTDKSMAPAHYLDADLPEADQDSLQAMPTSCSPTDECLPQSRNYIHLQDHVEHALVPPILPESNVIVRGSESTKLPIQQKDAVTGQQPMPKPPGTMEDNNGYWQQFVFENFDHNTQEASEEAIKETMKNLRPSAPSPSNAEDEDSEAARPSLVPSEIIQSLESGARIDELDFTDRQEFSSSAIATLTPVSHTATFGDPASEPLSGTDPVNFRTWAANGEPSSDPLFASDLPDASICATTKESSPGPLSAPSSGDPAAAIPSDEAVVGSLSSSSSLSPCHMNDLPGLSNICSLATEEQDKSPSVGHPSSVSERNEADDSFKFARPKPFLGKKRAHLDEQRQIALSAPQIRGQSMTWRRQKRTGDGRARIRQVPNLNSDPIEDVEDAVPLKEAQQSSLFASLDTEENLN